MFAEKLCILSDEELASRYCDTRDHRVFQEIYLRYKDELFRYCAQMVPHRCTQLMEAFWSAFLDTPPELQRRRLKNWLYIRLNRLLRAPGTSTPDADTPGDTSACAQVDALNSALKCSEILQAIQQLPIAQRNIFLLFTECGLSLATVADIERIPLVRCRAILEQSRNSIERALYGSARKPWKSAVTLAKEAEARAAEENANNKATEELAGRTQVSPRKPRVALPWGKTPQVAAASPATADRSVEVA